jgi:putative ABC transport system substrate-binding protein
MWFRGVGLSMTCILSLLVASLTAEAQPSKVHRVGFLLGRHSIEPDPTLEAFRQGLRDLGYVEGQNLIIAYRGAEGQNERLPDLAAELARLQVEVIVAVGSAATRAAQHATRTIPTVLTGTPDPLGHGFVASLARPGGNITGLSNLLEELPSKRLEILKETTMWFRGVGLIMTLILSLLAAPLVTVAQPAGKVHRNRVAQSWLAPP